MSSMASSLRLQGRVCLSERGVDRNQVLPSVVI
jgi:hypothetical protein